MAGQSFREQLERARQSDTPTKPAIAAPEPYRPFPVDLLPLPLARFVGEGSAALGCDPAYLALPALAVCASAIGNSRSLRLKRTWSEPCAIWSVVIGESGTLKTPAWRLALAPLHAAARRLNDQHKRELKLWAEQDSEGDRPTLKRVMCSDITVEKLAELLEDNPKGLLVTRDELAGWLGSFKRYKSQGGSDLPNWLELFAGGTINLDRKTGDRKHVSVDHALVSVTGGIQPGTLARCLTEEFFEAGLTARLLLAWPDRLPKVWSEAEVSEDTQERYSLLVDRLLALPMRNLPSGDRVPNRLLLNREAKALWVAFYNEWAEEQSQAEGELASAFAKLEGYAARLILLHHCVTMIDLESSDERDILPASTEAGIALTRWFAREAQRIYAALNEGDVEREVRRLVYWVRSRGGRVTVRDLQRSNNRRYPTAEVAEADLDRLVQGELGNWEEQPGGPEGGRPIRSFVLCTTHDKTDTTQPGPEFGGEAGADTTSDIPDPFG